MSRSTTLLKIADRKGQTCLHVAAASGHFEMVQVLLGQGSDFTSTDKVNYELQSLYLLVDRNSNYGQKKNYSYSGLCYWK